MKMRAIGIRRKKQTKLPQELDMWQFLFAL